MKIKIKNPKKRMGHIPHKSGSGTHEDKRTKRNRTRKINNEKAIREYV